MAAILSSRNVVVYIFLAVAVCYLIFFMYTAVFKRPEKTTEHFTEDEAYQARMDVMKVFELVLNRNPTSDEITKYSAYKNEQDILVQVLKDFKDGKKVVEEESLTFMSRFLQKKAVTEEEAKPQESFINAKDTSDKGLDFNTVGGAGDDRICVNKHYLQQILDDFQAKIDAMRVLTK